MRQCFDIFLNAAGARPYLVLLCLLIAGLLEAVGIGTLLPLFGTLMASTDSAEPSLFESLVRRGFDALGLSFSMEPLALTVLGFMILRSLVLFGTMSYVGISGARVANALRQKFVAAIFDARWRYYANQSGGSLASNISADGMRAAEAYVLSANVMTALLQIAAYTLISVLINWRVALLGLGCALVAALASRRLINLSNKAGRRLTEKSELMTSHLMEMLQTIKPLKAMHAHERMMDRLSKAIRKVMRAISIQQLSRYGLAYGLDVIIYLMVAGVALVALRISDANIADLLVLGTFFYQILYHGSKLARHIQNAAAVEASYLAFMTKIKEAAAEKEPEGGSETPHLAGGIRLENVSFSHGKRATVTNVNLTIPQGAITVLQGPSGAGKTTLIDIVSGLNRPQEGTVWIGDKAFDRISSAQWRRKIGYVPQELVLFHDTIRANMTLGESSFSDEAIEDALKLAGLEDFSKTLPEGLETEIGEYGSKLSGGQRQRLSLARALVRKPELLILDEVTSALDPETEAEVARNITRLRGRYTILAVTHRPIWTALADHLYKVDGGRVTKLKRAAKGQRS